MRVCEKAISLIITVYNTPIRDLKRCFNSILEQTYSNFEVIVIDDGSKTEIAQYLDGMAKRDARIQIHHIENAGVSHARNLGIQYSKGNYIAFCDSDDTLINNFLQNSLKFSLEYDLDLVIGGVLIRDKSKNYYSCCQKPEKDIWLYKDMDYLLDFALTGYPRKENKELGNMLIARVYPKLYRSELAKSVQFKENIRMSEDNLYSFDILSKSRRVGVTDECWYTYYQNEYSLTHNNDGIIEKRQKEQEDFAREIARLKDLDHAGRGNAYNVRLFHIFINYFYVLACTIFNLSKLKSVLHSSWGKEIQKTNLSIYYNVQGIDKKFQYMLQNSEYLYCYFILRCIRRKLGQVKRKLKSFS